MNFGDSNRIEETPARSLRKRFRGFLHAFIELFRLPRAFWAINTTYALDMFAYAGIIVLLKSYLTRDVGVSDAWSTVFTGCFAACVSLFMFGFGSYSERFGVRRALIASFVVLVAGRALLCFAPHLHGSGASAAVAILAAAAGLFVVAAGEGVLQTANYSGLKQYTDDRTSAMGFGLNYAFFNLGSFFVGLLSPEVRVGVDDLRAATAPAPASSSSVLPNAWLAWLASFSHSGIEAIFWVCTGVTALTVLLAVAWFTPAAEKAKLRPEDEKRVVAKRAAEAGLPLLQRIRSGPFGDARFTFFVFILLPARTMFGYQIHIFTEYILRAYPKQVADKAEWFSNSINPLVIVATVPIITALTRRMNMVRLMLVGTLVTALPTFLLCLGEHWYLLLIYTVVFSIGEALWQPRFYQFAADLAPEGKMGSYMAAANIPWLLAKFTTGLYAGYMLSVFCPATGARHPGVMWAIYGAFALVSPIGLWLARNWLRAGLHTNAAEAAAAKTA